MLAWAVTTSNARLTFSKEEKGETVKIPPGNDLVSRALDLYIQASVFKAALSKFVCTLLPLRQCTVKSLAVKTA